MPETVDDATVKMAAAYRSKNRVPALAYVHSNGAAICRCAQPFLIAYGREADQLLLSAIFKAGRLPDEPARTNFIVDARMFTSAFANVFR